MFALFKNAHAKKEDKYLNCNEMKGCEEVEKKYKFWSMNVVLTKCQYQYQCQVQILKSEYKNFITVLQ